MGNDGGVVAVKRKFMRHANTKPKDEKGDAEMLRMRKMQLCAISEQPLRAPIVVCALGNLYNKEALLEHLLARTVPAKFAHISSLKDVVTCNFSQQKDGGSDDAKVANYVCPVTMTELNGKQPFVVLGGCGCVVSERALKEVQSKECLVCGKPMDTNKLIHLFLSEAKYAEEQQRLLAKKAEEKLLKKEKKRSKEKAARDVDGGEEKKEKKNKKRKTEAGEKNHAATLQAGGGQSNRIAIDAASSIAKEKASNKVFASLFSTDKDSKKSANDLLMTVGGLRYTLS